MKGAVLPETDVIKVARERGRDTLDFEGAKHRSRAVIDFIDARGMDIDEAVGGRHRFEQWQKEAILEAFEIGPEAMIKRSEPP
jgi:hypothetical protein